MSKEALLAQLKATHATLKAALLQTGAQILSLEEEVVVSRPTSGSVRTLPDGPEGPGPEENTAVVCPTCARSEDIVRAGHDPEGNPEFVCPRGCAQFSVKEKP